MQLGRVLTIRVPNQDFDDLAPKDSAKSIILESRKGTTEYHDNLEYDENVIKNGLFSALRWILLPVIIRSLDHLGISFRQGLAR